MSTAAHLSREELEQAFTLFTQASEQLAASYQELQQQVTGLTEQLAIANGALLQQYQEKAALSERLGVILQAMPAGVVEIEADGCVVDANAAAQALLAGDMVGQDWSGWSARLLPTASPDEYEFVTAAGLRRLHVAETRLAQTARRVVVLHDISENYQIRLQLERHQRLSQMGEMAARLAHQLRTPLATALLHVGNLANPRVGAADRQRFTDKALDRLRYLESLIQQTLLFVKGQQVGSERVHAADVVAEVAATMEPQLRRVGVQFHSAVAPGAYIRVERKTLIGVLINLMENAMQACRSGDSIELLQSCTDSAVYIAVRDSGCGIDPAVVERLFDPFFTTRSEGTGLGLAIVRSAVEAWGGQVAVESQPGLGSCFTLRLPVEG